MTIEEFKTLSSCYNVPSISVDFYKDGYSCLSSKQLDNARCVVISLTENGIFKEMWADGIARIRMKKPDDTYIYNDCVNIDDGRILCRFSEQMLATSGKSCADIQITRENGDIYSTKLFYINISALPYDSSTIESSNEFDALNKLIEDEGQRIETVKQLENTITANESIRNENESVRQTNEEHRITAEISRETKTNTAVSNANIAIQNANNATAAAINATEKANTSAAKADTATTNANTATERANISAAKADTAAAKADTATANANTATTNANTSAAKADTSAAKADTATANANNATTKANTATTNANNATTNANASATKADTATTNANNATDKANTSAAKADTAATKADTATANANTATANADTATTKANASAAKADTSAAKADTATTNANNATTNANAATANANTATTNANNATTNANASATKADTASTNANAKIQEMQSLILGNGSASGVSYNNINSGLTAVNVQDALDKTIASVKSNTNAINTHKASADHDGRYHTEAEVNSLFTTHKTSADHDGRYYTETEVNNLLATKTPLNHASTATSYGVGSGSAFGHVKLSDIYASSVGAASSGIGASQSSVYNAYNQLNGSKANASHTHSYLPLSGGTVTGALACNRELSVTEAINVNGTISSGGKINSGGAIYSEGTINLVNGKYLRSTDLSDAAINLIGLNSSGNVHLGAYYSSTDPGDIPVYLHTRGETYNFQGTYFGPGNSNTAKLGSSVNLWSTVYAKTGTINTSDRTKKHDINDLTALHEQLFLKLSPKSFVFNDGDRVHIGAISQDVEEAMLELGITAEQFAGFCKDIRYEYTEFNDVDGEPIESSKVPVRDADENIVYDYSLRYQEFIFLTIHMVQKLYDRVDSLEKRLLEIEEKLSSN